MSGHASRAAAEVAVSATALPAPITGLPSVAGPASRGARGLLVRARAALDAEHGLAGFLGFVVITSLPYLVTPRTWYVFSQWASRLAGTDATLHALSYAPPIPGRLILLHLVSLAAFWLPAKVRLPIAAVAALAGSVAAGLIDAPSLAAMAVVSLAMYGLFRSPVPRPAMLAVTLAVPVALHVLAHRMGWTVLDRSGFALGFMVLLWQAGYEVSRGRTFSLPGFVGYLKTRLLFEGPVLASCDVEPHPIGEPDLRRRAAASIAVALIARAIGIRLEMLLTGGWRESTGLSLLLYSYLNYLSLSLTIVFSYSLGVGILRLFGLPVRDNFGRWFLARTPNEHWQRWNTLFREWLLTVTFYPLMRWRRNLFAAVVVTLLSSGCLHLYSRAFTEPLDLEIGALVMSYWLVNGLAIYAVLAVPRRFPALVARLGLGRSRFWSVTGWMFTNAFYAVMFFLHHECHDLRHAGLYLARLFGSGGS